MALKLIPWVLSGLACVTLWLMGNKNVWGPRIGLASQLLWAYYTIITKQWGLVPGMLLYAVIHARNLWRWRHASHS